MGISAMISRTTNGMKEGLRLLGLPDYPLVFIPGHELVLCGHDVREGINEMIHNWMTDEADEFYSCLLRLRDITSKPILTEDEVQLMERQDEWKKLAGPDGKPRYVRRDDCSHGNCCQDEDDDDEVVDLPDPDGPSPAAQPSSTSAEQVTPREAQEPPGPEAPPACQAVEEDYYQLLGVSPDAALSEIRIKFRALVITEHPERGGDPRQFQRLNKAYSVLSDQRRRQEYNESRHSEGGRASLA